MWVSYLFGGTILFPYQVYTSGPSDLRVQLLLPDVLGFRYTTGEKLPILALIAGDNPVTNAMVEAQVLCQGSEESKIMLYDDGQYGDGLAGDGFNATELTRVTQASVNNPVAVDQSELLPAANDESSCSVALTAFNGDFQREAMGGFSVLEGEDVDPENGVPDTIDEAYGDLTTDPDLDELDTYA